jgi:proteasome accessory factor B
MSASSPQTRPPLARFHYIQERIASGAYPNCVSLAAELELSLPTIKRDIRFMRDRLKLPIEYATARHGYYFSGRVTPLPGVPFVNESELAALFAAEKALAPYPGTPFTPRYHAAVEKLKTRLAEEKTRASDTLEGALSFRAFAPEETDPRCFDLLTRALTQGRAVAFQYLKPGTKTPQPRRVHPYHLSCIGHRWYLFAHDLARREVRTFALSRLTNPKLTSERFARPTNFDVDAHLCGSFQVFKGRHDYQVLIAFDGWATDLLRSRRWSPPHQFDVLPDGCSRLSMRLSALDEVLQWVLSWGPHASVLSPQALFRQVARTAAEVVTRSGGTVTWQTLP